MTDVTLFVGPTAYGLSMPTLLGPADRVLPPVRRGDIDRLVSAAIEPAVLVICDGVFHSEPAVSHAEICRALDAGWQVWGVSSIGAIRAFELRGEGMHGFGYVHAMFDRFDDFTDDEMCLLHFPEAPYFPVSEALVNLRFGLEKRGAQLGLSSISEKILLATLRSLWFGDRTVERMRSVMVEVAGIEAAGADALLAWIEKNRVKTIDLVALLASRPWLD